MPRPLPAVLQGGQMRLEVKRALPRRSACHSRGGVGLTPAQLSAYIQQQAQVLLLQTLGQVRWRCRCMCCPQIRLQACTPAGCQPCC
jgi:hypothetical protein